MTTFLGGVNYSIYALPLYYVLAITPHAYAITLATSGDVGKWDNRNPRAAGLKADLYNNLDRETFAKYERGEAAHYNSMESFPLFSAAVVLGNIARLPVTELNAYVMGVGALRVAYIVSYITASTNKTSYVRSSIWFASIGWSIRMLWKAGSALA